LWWFLEKEQHKAVEFAKQTTAPGYLQLSWSFTPPRSKPLVPGGVLDGGSKGKRNTHPFATSRIKKDRA
jgi:hypothetical protein